MLLTDDGALVVHFAVGMQVVVDCSVEGASAFSLKIYIKTILTLYIDDRQ